MGNGLLPNRRGPEDLLGSGIQNRIFETKAQNGFVERSVYIVLFFPNTVQ